MAATKISRMTGLGSIEKMMLTFWTILWALIRWHSTLHARISGKISRMTQFFCHISTNYENDIGTYLHQYRSTAVRSYYSWSFCINTFYTGIDHVITSEDPPHSNKGLRSITFFLCVTFKLVKLICSSREMNLNLVNTKFKKIFSECICEKEQLFLIKSSARDLCFV
jgi:hypothetical protein